MKLLLEATVAAKSQVLADGQVRVTVTNPDTGAMVGRLSVTAELWEWAKLWAVEAMLAGWEIEIRETEYNPDKARRSETMRGRLLEAVEIAAARGAGEGESAAAGPKEGKGAAPAAPAADSGKTRISPLFHQVQKHRKGKRK